MSVIGRTGSPFVGRRLCLWITPETKTIRFLKPIHHPNVGPDGTLRFSKSLIKTGTVSELKAITEDLLSKPDLRAEYIANPRAAREYQTIPAVYFIRAKASA